MITVRCVFTSGLAFKSGKRKNTNENRGYEMKRFAAILLAAALSVSVFAGCSSESESDSGTYDGVLTKIRLGMPLSKVIQLNSDCNLYYDNDTQIWCVNTDTELMELKDKIPADSQFYNVDDSLITYTFKYDEAAEENYLTAYLQELPCLVDRKTATAYYESKAQELKTRYGATEASSTCTGTEGIDMTLKYDTILTLSSFKLTLTMKLTYDTVDSVDGYYATYFAIEVKELENKAAVDVGTASE